MFKIIAVPTVDVEGVHGHEPFEQMILGKVDKKNCGVLKLAKMFSKYGIQATFFVDVFEYTLWGEDRIRFICEKLLEMGQDVQLHTHPAWRDDPRDFKWLREIKRKRSFFPQQFDFMAKMPLEKQIEVLEYGIYLFEKWLGFRPIAHRSGGYSINDDTIKALARCNFKLDSSMYFSHPNSKVVWCRNKLIYKNGIIELPVTVLKYILGFSIKNKNLKFYSKIMKTDIDVCSCNEIIAYIQQAKNTGIKILNIFMHSYSLLEYDFFYKNFKSDKYKIINLNSILKKLINDPDVKFMSCSQLVKYFKDNPLFFEGNDGIPEIYANNKIIKLGFKKGQNWLKLIYRNRCYDKN